MYPEVNGVILRDSLDEIDKLIAYFYTRLKKMNTKRVPNIRILFS
jgi:hypothetical protein